MGPSSPLPSVHFFIYPIEIPVLEGPCDFPPEMASHRPLYTARLTILPADSARLEALLSSPGAFTLVTGYRVADGFCPFDGVLATSLKAMRHASDHDRPWWTPRLLVLDSACEVIGVIRFKGPPGDNIVEVGYSVAPAHQACGFATEALCEIARHAIRFCNIRVIRAHTSPEPSASTRVLEKSGFQKVTEILDPVEGPVWRWERSSLNP
jgi:[ribosomal protein S5]-alanine N-acetyltransferase